MTTDYDSAAEFFDRHAADSAYNAYYDRPAVLELAGDVRGLSVLDAGCGPGYYCEELVSRGATVTGIDSSHEMVKLARQRLRGTAQIRVADLQAELPFPADAFDLVICALVIHHVDDRRFTFRELARVTRPSGAIVMSTQHPTTDWLRKGGSYFDVKLETDIWTREGQAFVVHFWREPLSDLCEAAFEAGLMIERLIEPRANESMRSLHPEEFAKLQHRPGFIALRLRKPPILNSETNFPS